MCPNCMHRSSSSSCDVVDLTQEDERKGASLDTHNRSISLPNGFGNTNGISPFGPPRMSPQITISFSLINRREFIATADRIAPKQVLFIGLDYPSHTFRYLSGNLNPSTCAWCSFRSSDEKMDLSLTGPRSTSSQ
jgi:hypothetical protein